ncbi:MAG: TIM-barrel domain-containing protein [Verrucomicrobiota bacterium]
MNTKYFNRLESVTKVRKIKRGIELESDPQFRELLRVEVIQDDLIRLKISRNRIFDEEPTFAVCADLDIQSPEFTLEESQEMVRVLTSRMSMTLYKHPFWIDAHRADGSVIFESYQDEENNWWAYATLNDEFVVRRKCRPEDAFFGLGEKSGRFNRKGRNFTLWNTDVLDPNVAGGYKAHPSGDPASDPTSTEFDPYYISIPFFYHMPNMGDSISGFFFDNGYLSRVEFEQPFEYLIHFKGGQYTEYIFAGPAMPEILSAYTWLTGRMSPPPIWALGYHQCRWFAYTQTAFERLAQNIREQAIPCDALWLDIDYMDGYRVFTWNKERFPDHTGMLKRLSDQGFRVITIIDPGVKHEHGYAVFDDAVERDVLCKTESGALYLGLVWPGKTAFPDFVTPAARKWWGELNAAHVRSGLAGIWNDMNEPATGDIPPGAMRFGNGSFSHERYHNQYGMLMAMGTVEGLLDAMPDKRTFVLSRSGSAGIQRYAANWLGDNVSRWDHLWMSIPMSLGLGTSGQPFVGADIGGFMGNTSAELLVRWFQYGALTPFCRNHNNANQADQYPWAYGHTVQELCRSALELRYRLLPYIYSTFIQASENGSPVQRPLIFDYQNDPTTREIDDEFLFGQHLLVAPIYAEGCTARQVYLPEGTWYHWHTGEKFTGCRFVIAPAPMDYIPLYAHGGAVIPTWPKAPHSTMNYDAETVVLHIFIPDEDGETSSMLHEDDGQTFAFRDGCFLRTHFILARRTSRITIQASVTGNGFPEFARKKFLIRFQGPPFKNISINDEPVHPVDGEFVLENNGVDFLLHAELA